MYDARPTVNAGSRMCQATTQVHCKRESMTASSVIWPPKPLLPHVDSCQVNIQVVGGRTLGRRSDEFSALLHWRAGCAALRRGERRETRRDAEERVPDDPRLVLAGGGENVVG